MSKDLEEGEIEDGELLGEVAATSAGVNVRRASCPSPQPWYS